MRNLEQDLRAIHPSQGPWRWPNNSPIDTKWKEEHPEDYVFIARARDGFIEALERAIKAEALVKKYTDILSFCDPREDYGEGMECQFCHAKAGEVHGEDCIYKRLTTWKERGEE